MRRSIRTYMIMVYVAVVLVCVVVGAAGTWWLFRSQLFIYSRGRSEERQADIVQYFADTYTGAWENLRAERGIMRGDFGFTLFRNDGHVVFEKPYPTTGHMGRRMLHHSGGDTTEMETRTYPVIVNGEKVGEVLFTYPAALTVPEQIFYRKFSRYLLYATGGLLAVGVFAGVMAAGRLSHPISALALRARAISAGDYEQDAEQNSQKTQISEIEALNQSIDDLGRTLAQQQRARKQIMKDIAHELRTPVSVAMSLVDAVIDGVRTASLHDMALCQNAMERISVLIADIEKVTDMEAEVIHLNYEVCDMTEQMRMIEGEFTSLFASRGIAFRVEPPEPFNLYIDIVRFHQMMDNLLSNALRYTPPGGEVTVMACVRENEAHIAVSDTGIGISSHDLPHIFERFYRADQSRSKATGGVGIGLSITKAIAEAMGGRIEAESTPNQGSRFVFSKSIR